MKIDIRQDDITLSLSDELLDNDNFVNVRLIGFDTDMEQDIPIDELFAALIAFDAKRSRRLETEKQQTL